MKKFWIQLGKCVCYFLLYYIMQLAINIGFVVLYIFKAVWETTAGGGIYDVNAVTQGAIDYMMQKQNDVVIISGVLTLLILWLFFLLRKKSLVREAAVVKTSVKYVPIAIGLGVGMVLTIDFGMSLLPESWLEAYAQSSDVLTGGSPLAIIVSTMVMAPLIEEVIFRGLILSRLRRAVPDAAAIVVSALIFGVAHGQILWICYTFFMGLVLALVAVKSESVVPGILLHMAFNICGVVIPMLVGDVVSVELYAAMVISGIVLTVVLLIVLFRLGKKEEALQATKKTESLL